MLLHNSIHSAPLLPFPASTHSFTVSPHEASINIFTGSTTASHRIHLQPCPALPVPKNNNAKTRTRITIRPPMDVDWERARHRSHTATSYSQPTNQPAEESQSSARTQQIITKCESWIGIGWGYNLAARTCLESSFPCCARFAFCCSCCTQHCTTTTMASQPAEEEETILMIACREFFRNLRDYKENQSCLVRTESTILSQTRFSRCLLLSAGQPRSALAGPKEVVVVAAHTRGQGVN